MASPSIILPFPSKVKPVLATVPRLMPFALVREVKNMLFEAGKICYSVK